MFNNKKEEKSVKVLIIGSGPAGYTAAIYAARAGLQPILVSGMQKGGQLMTTTDVENFPGFRDVIQGPWLMEEMLAQAKHVGTQIVDSMITNVDFSKRPFICQADNGTDFLAETVIIATGAQAKWLGVTGEDTFRGFGVSACATCDGFFFKNKEVAIVGGGNTAVEEAMFLTNFAKKVILIHRKNSLRAEKIAQERLFSNPKITVLWDTVVTEIIGETSPLKTVNSLKITNLTNGQDELLKVDGLFVAIGHTPQSSLFRGQLDLDGEGYILTAPNSTKTNVSGVFAAGDVQDKVFRQAITSAGYGCMAALEAEKFLMLNA